MIEVMLADGYGHKVSWMMGRAIFEDAPMLRTVMESKLVELDAMEEDESR